MFGVLAEPLIAARADLRDALAAGQGVTEFAPDSKAAEEIRATADPETLDQFLVKRVDAEDVVAIFVGQILLTALRKPGDESKDPVIRREVDRTARKTLVAMTVPEDTFGLLRGLLESLESRLLTVRQDVERRNALAEATPSIWPAHGWISSNVGPRRDPMTGSADYHSGLDIAGERGQPVYATASGLVKQLGYQGAYGNLVTIDHGFGLESRYGHLLNYAIKKGAKVKRGDVIGHVGATGRATGYHLHYEVLANGRLLNPLQLLTQKPRDR